MKLKILFLLTLASFVTISLQAQTNSFNQDRDPNMNSDLYLIPEFRIGYSILNTNYPLLVDAPASSATISKSQFDNYVPFNYSASVSAGYHFTPQFAAGLGICLERYTQPNATTLPIFIDMRGYFEDAKNTPFAFAKLGYSFQWWKAFDPGVWATLGVGYKFFWGKQCMTASFGYEFKNTSDWLLLPDGASYSTLNRHSFTLGIGMIF
jgi:hypothetical protein